MLDAIVEARPPTKRVSSREADIVVHGPGIAAIGHHRAEPRAVEAEAMQALSIFELAQ